MYLLNTSTSTLHYFAEPNIPDYAILSHRWDEVEVSFADIQNNKSLQKMSGFSKIRGCCAQASSDGWQYVWIDSCCIDKSSSAELSEAINSMFLWYSKAQACYAYLSDVSEIEIRDELSTTLVESTFHKSKWFTRGWTLQELLAPEFVTFFTREWKEIGTKLSLHAALSSITGIRSEILQGYAMISSASVAERMSWASRRITSRTEDVAYCLLGLFGVYMSPLYGEGKNAFIRLQLEIMRSTNDESIFAWITDNENTINNHGSLLALSPTAFKYSGDVRRTYFDSSRPPFQMTNKGLRMELSLLRMTSLGHKMPPDTQVAVLNCTRSGQATCIALFLRRRYRDEFVRIGIDSWQEWPRDLATSDSSKREVVYVQQWDISQQSQERQDVIVSARVNYFNTDDGDSWRLSSMTSNKEQPKDEENTEDLEFELEAHPSGPLFVALLFSKRHIEYFTSCIVLVNFSRKPYGLEILTSENLDAGVFEHPATLIVLSPTKGGRRYPPVSLGGRHADEKEKFHEYLLRCCFDRISQVLETGNSISVVLKKGRTEQRRQRYVVQIEVDNLNGRSRYPGPQDSRSRSPWPDVEDLEQREVKDLESSRPKTTGLQKLLSKLGARRTLDIRRGSIGNDE